VLVLERKLNEMIVIDGGITIKLVSVVGGRVRLGIEAPKSVRIDREEVHRQRQRQIARA